VKWRNTLVALLILAVLVVFYYFYETRGAEGRRLAAERAGRALGLEDGAEVVEVVVENELGVLRLEAGADGAWRLTQPVEAAAEAQRVLAVVGSLKRVRLVRTLAEADGVPEDCGLDAPQARLTLMLADGGPPRVLEIGNPTPLGGGYFARRDQGGDVLVVGPGMGQALTLDVERVLERSVADTRQDGGNESQ
jgi:hypothetical protein